MRKPRENFEGGFFHVGTRGNDRQCVFPHDVARIIFMRTFAKVAVRYSWLVYSWCLMTTHYHVVVHTPHAGLSEGMRDLNGKFARAWNRYHGREDHVFGRRFGSVTIRSDDHLQEACRYVVLNPVRAGICRDPSDWPWSSYRATIGAEHAPSFLAVSAVLQMFADDPARAAAHYRRFVAAGIGRRYTEPRP